MEHLQRDHEEVEEEVDGITTDDVVALVERTPQDPETHPGFVLLRDYTI